MPGISIYRKPQETWVHPILSKFENYAQKLRWDSGSYYIDTCAYPEYPLFSEENDDYFILIEGRIYSNSNLFETIITSIHEYKEGRISSIKSFIEGADGDYIVTVVDKNTGRIFLFNDYQGRLPLYYNQNKGIISREISSMNHWVGDVYDSFAQAEYLLLGYCLGNKTLYKDIFVLQGGAIIELDDESFRITSLIEEHFDKYVTHEEPDVLVKDLRDLFVDAVRKRVSSEYPNLLSLSGGLDSRALLASFNEIRCSLKTATYSDLDKTADKDIEQVERLLKFTDYAHNIIFLEGDDEYRDTLWQMKRGMNYSGMSFILEYFEKIKVPGLQFFTGDGGDKVFPDLRPLRKIFGKNDFLSYLLKYNTIIPLDKVSALCGIPPKEIKSHLLNYFASYPENDFASKYTRFLVMERGRKWLFEGEDRNRYYFEEHAPFYSLPLYKKLMSIHPKHKKDFKLFSDFLISLDKSIAIVPNANWGVSVNNLKQIHKIYLRQRIKSWLPDFIFERLKGDSEKNMTHFVSVEGEKIGLNSDQIEYFRSASTVGKD